MKVKNTLATLLVLLLATTILHAEPEMADGMRSDGKIYVVVAVLATIFAGIFAYLIYLDRKITKVEKDKK